MTADTGSVLANAPTATPSLSSSHPAPSIDLHELLGVLEALRGGDFSVCLAGDHDGTLGRIASVVNDIAAGNESMARQLERIGKAVGEQGRTRQRVKFGLSQAPGARWRVRSIR
ncbi:MAG: hypothetical protein KA171_07950 [Reyranella sp.]|nr:hypothetical protein [Reyranella sp.]